MRILYVDIDSLRPDHLGCYGYHRNTSPNIDRLAGEGLRFDNCYISDAPCLPSRTSLWTGRFGYHTGVVDHGGTQAQPFIEGPGRGFRDVLDTTSWMSALRRQGLYTATISSFGERHSAWWWYAGFREIYNPGKGGMEIADDVTGPALEWIERHARRDNWFLHVNYWDAHGPYRTPEVFGDPFGGDPLPAWLTEEVRRRGWQGFGPHSAQDLHGYPDQVSPAEVARYPRLPLNLASMADVKCWIDGYDTGIRYADEHIGRLLDALAGAGVLDDTVVVVSADHGENQGELNVWGDHQTADQFTCRVPLIVRWPGVTRAGSLDAALHYQTDWAATAIELLGGRVAANWDGASFADALRRGRPAGRESLVVSQAAWACQRGVRYPYAGEPYLCLRTYHEGHKQLEPVMLFNLARDPHEQVDLSGTLPAVVDYGLARLADWERAMMLTARTNVDPMMTVLREGGPYHTRGHLPAYLAHLRATGRGHHADRLAQAHSDDAEG